MQDVVHGTVEMIIDHVSIVSVYLKTGEKKPHIIHFDRRSFANFSDAEGPIVKGMTLYHGYTEDGTEVISTEPIQPEHEEVSA